MPSGALALMLSALALAAATADGVAPDAAALPREVRSIFEAKCMDCHGPDLPRPDGDFGYATDLARIAANPDYVVRGDPNASELYLMVLHDEMPGEDADVPPLTAEEKETVRQWIAAGAPAGSPGVEHSPARVANPPPPPLKRPLPFGRRLLRALGKFHPPSAHFPIALLIAAFPAEIMWKLTRKPSWKATVRFLVTAGAGSAVVTAALGWCGAAFTNYTLASAGILEWHRWLGTGTALWAVALAVLSEIAHREGQPRSLRYTFRACLLLGILLVGVAGYYGASLTFGPGHFSW